MGEHRGERIKRMASETWDKLSPGAREVLGQMFMNGPQYDGYVVSKSGRDALYSLGLIDRGDGWQWLTREGVEVAVHAPVEAEKQQGCVRNTRWKQKQVV